MRTLSQITATFLLVTMTALPFTGCKKSSTQQATASVGIGISVPAKLPIDRYNVILQNIDDPSENYRRDGATSDGASNVEAFEHVTAGDYRVDAIFYDNAAQEARAYATSDTISVQNGSSTSVTVTARDMEFEYGYLLFANNNELMIRTPGTSVEYDLFFDTSPLQPKPLGGTVHYGPSAFTGDGPHTAQLQPENTNTTQIAFLTAIDNSFEGADTVFVRTYIPLTDRWPDGLVAAYPNSDESPASFELGGNVSVTIQRLESSSDGG
jgi:hypothetical protein